MSRLLPLLILVVGLAACSDDTWQNDRDKAEKSWQETREQAEKDLERARERAAEDLARAREQAEEELERARERVEEAREQYRESNDAWSEPARREAEDALDEIGVSGAIGRVLEDVGRALQNDADVQPVAHRELSDLLPRRLQGFERNNSDSETKGAFGIRFSKASSEYRNDEGDRLRVDIVDLGTLKGAVGEGLDRFDLYSDQESDSGFSRTTEIDGYPAFEQVETRHRDEQQLVVFVGERFVVHVEARGRDLSSTLARDVVEDLPLRKLRALAD